jgi:DNA helicase-2/ATP-dependent DNA helicase PcrA
MIKALFKSDKRRCLTRGKNQQLIACAGSGKTEVVARRVVHLLDPQTLLVSAPRNIVAFTFTEKAATKFAATDFAAAAEAGARKNGSRSIGCTCAAQFMSWMNC